MAIGDRISKVTHCDSPREMYLQVSCHHYKMPLTMPGLANYKPPATKST